MTNNIITAVGGSAGTPISFIDFWNADKAGTLSLHSRTGITGVDASPVNLTRNARPTDRVVLGGARQDVYMVVTAWTNMASATVRLIGTNSAGNAQTEDLAINGNGTYYATKYYAALTQSQVTTFSGTGSFAYEVKQAQWGVVWQNNSLFWRFDCKLQIGDGSTSTFFSETNKLVMFQFSVGATQVIIRVKSNATATFGVLHNASTYDTSQGVCFILNIPWGQDTITALEANATLYLYSCFFCALGGVLVVQGSQTGANVVRVWNCMFSFGSYLIEFNSSDDLFNVTICGAGNANVLGLGGITGAKVNRVTASKVIYYYDNYGLAVNTLSNLHGRDVTGYAVKQESPSSCNLVNADFDVWTFTFTGSGNVYRQYTVDIKVTDKNNNPLSGATVTLVNKNNNQIFSLTTAPDGTITEQTVSRGYYNQANGNTLQDYSPHTLTISKMGYQTYVKTFVLGSAINWEIKLAKAHPILVDKGSPVLNLNASEPENVNVFSL